MKYYLGIDGGGTKTKIMIINDLKEVLYEKVGGPSSVDTVTSDVTFNNIKNLIDSFRNDSPNLYFSGLFAGLGGIVFNEQKKDLIKLFKTLPGINNDTKIVVENDMYNALYSGLLFDEGIGLIVGTGMVSFGKKGNKTHKCAGWGFKEGELGSGYALGKQAISYMIRCFDNRLEKDDFAKEVASKLNLYKSEDIITIMDDIYLNRTLIASLAPIVTKYANNNHPYALKIIEEHTDEIKLAVEGVYNTLNLKKPTIVIVGGLGNADGAFKTMLHLKLKEIDPYLKIIKPIVDPALAGALYIKNLK